ncbi:GCN5-related N-acetyltransferase [Pseudobacteroides cellulosolvens ATCC 35603 = DSM 2933]|uniref:GCN5-related N-acetyltransferase n=2 Tax=Pseudobacteroides cellulosolvens TaxID=35825 RepID=A0A0L6JUP9_9FIRM|nr:GCN5-related N-acetyltransferase [Pseudobacteroides cellulosolvens ATCC 35603 = DSM 2933]
MTMDEIINYCLSKPGAYIDFPFGSIPICVKVQKRLFAQMYPHKDDCKITLNCDRMTGEFYRNSYPDTVVRGYHCPRNLQPYFNTIHLNGMVSGDELKAMIDHSYSTVVRKLPKKLQKELELEGDNMTDITLELPTIEHESMANQFKDEFFENNERVINGSALFDQMDYKKWFDNNERNRNPATVSNDWVAASTFFAVRKSDNKIIGMIDVRHNLNNKFLADYGGHIGYAVRPSERRKGYATSMLKMALEYAKSLSLNRVMLGCYADNIASIKTIVKCGGKLTESKQYVDGKQMNVYWIEVK